MGPRIGATVISEVSGLGRNKWDWEGILVSVRE